MNIQATGKMVARSELADAFGVGMDVIRDHLLEIGLVTIDPDGVEVASHLAQRSGLWMSGGARFLGGGDWDAGLIPELSARLGSRPVSGDDLRANRSSRLAQERRQHRLRLQADRDLAQDVARVREMELSKMTGMHRVASMISQRETVLSAQCPDDTAWNLELVAQRARATSLARECSFTGEYPDFETELVDRVIFTLDEQVVAAERFVSQGRATHVLQGAAHTSGVPQVLSSLGA